MPSHVVAQTAVTFLMMTNVITPGEFVEGVGRVMLMIVGILVGPDAIFTETGIPAYAATVITRPWPRRHQPVDHWLCHSDIDLGLDIPLPKHLCDAGLRRL